jgi:hypothetical protein
MSDTSSGGRQASSKKRPKASVKPEEARASSEGVLANLPRTRPQRSSARRNAARRATPETRAVSVPETKRVAKSSTTQAKAAPKTKPVNRARASSVPPAKPGRTKPVRKQTTAKKPTSQTKPTAKPIQDPAPRQGFEAESDHLSGPVQPPGGVDLFASAAELAGELTKSGLSAGGRLLKDAFARLPLN